MRSFAPSSGFSLAASCGPSHACWASYRGISRGATFSGLACGLAGIPIGAVVWLLLGISPMARRKVQSYAEVPSGGNSIGMLSTRRRRCVPFIPVRMIPAGEPGSLAVEARFAHRGQRNATFVGSPAKYTPCDYRAKFPNQTIVLKVINPLTLRRMRPIIITPRVSRVAGATWGHVSPREETNKPATLRLGDGSRIQPARHNNH